MKYHLRHTWLVQPSQDGLDLLTALRKHFAGKPSAFWEDCLRDGRVSLDGVKTSATSLLKPGQTVSVNVPDFEEPDLETTYDVVWRHGPFLGVNKPADLPVHPTSRFFYQTMTGLIRRDEGRSDLSPLHRLDRETSGLMLFFRPHRMMRTVQRRLRHFMAAKFYLALVQGRTPPWPFSCSEPLAEAGEPPVLYRMIPNPEGKACHTVFFPVQQQGERSLLLVRPFTGRKHQIRAHLALLGFPLVGDKLYVHDARYFLKRARDDLQVEDVERLGAPHHLLHALALHLRLPDGTTRLLEASRLPPAFTNALAAFPAWERQVRDFIARSTLRRSERIPPLPFL